MTLPRRTFLIQAGAVAGAAALGCDETPTTAGPVPPRTPARKPQALIDALEQMRTENRPGIALRISQNKDRRHDLGHQLVYLLNQETPELRELYCEVVFVALENDVIHDHVPQSDPAHDVILLSDDGGAVAGISWSFRHESGRFPEVVRTLVHGIDGSRLKERGARIRRTADPAVIGALDRLGAVGGDPQKDRLAILSEAYRILPLLLQARSEALTQVRQKALREIVDEYCKITSTSVVAPILPYGVEAGPFQGGCGNDPCREQAPRESELVGMVACGMALCKPTDRSFIRYLTR